MCIVKTRNGMPGWDPGAVVRSLAKMVARGVPASESRFKASFMDVRCNAVVIWRYGPSTPPRRPNDQAYRWSWKHGFRYSLKFHCGSYWLMNFVHSWVVPAELIIVIGTQFP